MTAQTALPPSRPKIVIVGNGMAGLRFAQDLLGLLPDADLTMVGDEPGGAYNRAQLPLVLAGTARPDSIELADRGWYAARGIQLVGGTGAWIDRTRQLLGLADGTTLRYDILVLALGSAAVLPPAEGLFVAGPSASPSGALAPGAVAFRTLADCTRIQALAAGASHAVVLGGGVLGLETARSLSYRGRSVTLVQRGPRLMERQLDADAARVLTRTARGLGVTVRAGAAVRRVLNKGGRVSGVELDDGQVVRADLLVLCCGTRPRTDLARAAGLATGAGIVVDDQLRSVTDPRVFAIGDCAEHRGRTHGLVAAAWWQAKVAAEAVARQAVARQAVASHAVPGQQDETAAQAAIARPAVIRLKAAGIELAVLGSARGGGRADVIRVSDPARGVYQKVVVRDGRLVGAILLGDTRTAGTLTQLLDRGTSLPADRLSLLSGRRDGAVAAVDSPVTLPGHATICQCNGVTKAAICAAWQQGARDTAQVAARTRAATGCGTCRDAVQGIVDWLAAADPNPENSPTLVPA